MKSRIILFLLLIAVVGAFPQAQRDSLPRIQSISVDRLKEIVRRDSGNVVLVNAWATWCKPCREELPGLLQLRKEFLNKHFELILVSADDMEIVDNTVRPMLKGLGVDFSSFIMDDSSSEAFMAKMMPDWNEAIALPTSFLYDKKGNLAGRFVGGRTYAQFDKGVMKLLKE